jgi:hypothetical protein
MKTSHSILLGKFVENNRSEIESGGKTVKQLSDWAAYELGIKVPPHTLTDACKALDVSYRRVSQTTSEKRRLESALSAMRSDRDDYREALLSCVNSGQAQTWLLKKIAEDFPGDSELASAIEQKLTAAV